MVTIERGLNEIQGEQSRLSNSIDEKEKNQANRKRKNKHKPLMPREVTVLVICTITAHFIAAHHRGYSFRSRKFFGVQLWKWSLFEFIIFCSKFVTTWLVNVMVFVIERNFATTNYKVLYFLYPLKSVMVCFLWLGSIFMGWGILIEPDVKGPWNLIYLVSISLVTCVIGTGLWMLKIVIVKVLASRLYDEKKFFDRIQDLVFRQYVLQTLLWGPSVASLPNVSGTFNVIRVKLMWVVGEVVHLLCSTRSFIICNALHKTFEDEDLRNKDVETVVSQIFMNFKKNELREIHETDLLQAMKAEDIPSVLKLFEGAVERNVINEESLINWTVEVYDERKSLVLLLSDTNVELNNIMSSIVVFSISLMWASCMGFVTTRVLAIIVFPVLLIFGNIFKTILEGMIFVFVQHPFDIGDHCVIDDEQMVVEEIGILMTVFLRENNGQLCCRNSSLRAKPIHNYNRSSEIREILELLVDASTSDDNIAALKLKINEYLKSKPKNYRLEHSLQLRQIENMKLKYNLHITRTMNFQNYEEKNNQRSELLLELKKFFQDLGIKHFSVQFLN